MFLWNNCSQTDWQIMEISQMQKHNKTIKQQIIIDLNVLRSSICINIKWSSVWRVLDVFIFVCHSVSDCFEIFAQINLSFFKHFSAEIYNVKIFQWPSILKYRSTLSGESWLAPKRFQECNIHPFIQTYSVTSRGVYLYCQLLGRSFKCKSLTAALAWASEREWASYRRPIGFEKGPWINTEVSHRMSSAWKCKDQNVDLCRPNRSTWIILERNCKVWLSKHSLMQWCISSMRVILHVNKIRWVLWHVLFAHRG